MWLNSGVWPSGKYKVRKHSSLWPEVLFVLAFAAAVWFWRHKSGEGKEERNQPPTVETNLSPVSGTSSGRQSLTSAPVNVSTARTNRPSAITIPAPSEITPESRSISNGRLAFPGSAFREELKSAAAKLAIAIGVIGASLPPAIAISACPARIIDAASATASNPEGQAADTVVA